VTVLPLAHPDVNDLLTIVFVGSRKFKPEYLPWQHASDPQIEGAAVSPLDETALGLYPEDGYIPGFGDSVIHDHQSQEYLKIPLRSWDPHGTLRNLSHLARC